jgi:hypothetical protein
MRAQLSQAVAATVVAGMVLTGCAPSADEVVADAQAQADQIAADAQASAAEIAAEVQSEVDAAIADAESQAEGLQAEAETAADTAAGELGTDGGGGGSALASDKPEPAEGAAEPTTADPAADLAGGRFDITGLADATMALRQTLGSETLELLQVQLLQGGRTTFQVRDPNMPENVDQYTWNGVSLSAPEPVQLIGGGDLDSSVFPIAEVMVPGAQAAYDAAIGLGLEGGEVASMTLTINPFDGLAWGVPVSGTRESKVVYAATDGTVIRVV